MSRAGEEPGWFRILDRNGFPQSTRSPTNEILTQESPFGQHFTQARQRDFIMYFGGENAHSSVLGCFSAKIQDFWGIQRENESMTTEGAGRGQSWRETLGKQQHTPGKLIFYFSFFSFFIFLFPGDNAFEGHCCDWWRRTPEARGNHPAWPLQHAIKAVQVVLQAPGIRVRTSRVPT